MSELDERIERVKAIDIHPGDTIVVTLHDRYCRSEEIERLRDQLREHFPDNKVMVLFGADLSVVRPEPNP